VEKPALSCSTSITRINVKCICRQVYFFLLSAKRQ